MPLQLPSAPPVLGQEGFLGQGGAMPPSLVPIDGHRAELTGPPTTQPSARGGCLRMPRKIPYRDIIANKPNKRDFFP